MNGRTLDQTVWRLAIGGVGVVSLAVIGCGARQPPVALEQARMAYTQAQQNPVVATNAPVALEEASESLRRAERVWEDDHDAEEVQHLAYVTTQRVEIAQALASQKAAETNIQQLNNEREQVLLTARTREAQHAQQEATRAQQEAVQAQQVATQAQQATLQARQEAQEATARARQLEQDLAALQAQVKQTDRGMVLTLGDVLFEFDKATLKPGVIRDLYPLVTFLRQHSAREVIIAGHTDSIGSEDYNLDLSQRRAQAVRDFLIHNGLGASQVVARGLGEQYPVASNETATGRQLNRRVEVTIAQ